MSDVEKKELEPQEQPEKDEELSEDELDTIAGGRGNMVITA